MLQLQEILFLISSKGSFICTIPQTGYYIPWPLLYHFWSTDWNTKIFNGSTRWDRSSAYHSISRCSTTEVCRAPVVNLVTGSATYFQMVMPFMFN